MIFDLDANAKQIRKIKLILYPIITLLIGLLQISFVSFIEIDGVSPNLFIVFVVWIAITEGQFTALFAAFFIGLTYDILKMDVIGTNALSLIFTAFVAGFFYKEGKSDLIIQKYTFLIIVFISALVHNLVYYILYLKISEINFIHFFIKYGIASSFYSTVFAVFPMLLTFRKRI